VAVKAVVVKVVAVIVTAKGAAARLIGWFDQIDQIDPF
jgi:hypothetical protein